jgi:hypothetical protein
MTTTATRTAAIGKGRRPSLRTNRSVGEPQLRIEPKGAGRRPRMAALSVAIIMACTALFVVIYLHSTHLVAVIGVTQEISQGNLVEASDLRQVDLTATSGVQTVPVSAAQQVIGRPAAVTLLPGTLLTPEEIGGSRRISSNEAVVGVQLKPGMFPASGLINGEDVLVVLTGPVGSAVSGGGDQNSSGSGSSPNSDGSSGSGSSSTSTAPTVISTATVVGVNDNPDGSGSGDITASVEVRASDAPLVADSSAAGQVALVQIGGQA